MDNIEITSRVDSEQLTQIKNKFSLRDLANADSYESNQITRQNPPLVFGSSAPSSNLSPSVMRGLKYPLELDGQGGLKLSSGYDRLGEQILEILETRLGERVYRPFFGIPEVIFETIDEYALSQAILLQLRAFLPTVPTLDVKATLSEDGSAQIIVFYSVEGSEGGLVRYSFSV